jgi:DNA-binding transcriptional LysR family regulator
MNNRALLCIQKILEEGSISRAAQSLFIAQPSLSQYIKRLEDDLGTAILDRNAQPIKLTGAGEIFFQTEKDIQLLRKQRANQINDLFGLKRGHLTIGSSHYRSMYLLTKVLPVFKQRYPGIRINLEEGITEQLEECAVNGTTDFSIVLLPLSHHTDLAYEELFQEEILLVMPSGHKLCENVNTAHPRSVPYPSIDFSLLKNESFIVMKKGQRLRNSFFELCRKAEFTPRIILQTDSMATAQALAAAGVGVTIIPYPLALHNSFPEMPHYFSLKNQADTRKAVVAYAKKRGLTGAARTFIQVMKDVIRDTPAF